MYRYFFLATTVVLTTAFASPALAEPAIHPDEGLQHLHWQDARQAVGKTAFISGKVTDVGHHSDSG